MPVNMAGSSWWTKPRLSPGRHARCRRGAIDRVSRHAGTPPCSNRPLTPTSPHRRADDLAFTVLEKALG